MSILTSLAVGEPIDWGLVAIDAISGAVGGALTAVGAKVIADAVCEGVSNYAIQNTKFSQANVKTSIISNGPLQLLLALGMENMQTRYLIQL